MSKRTLFTGSGVATVTPMTADGRVYFKKYRELIERQIQSGTTAIIAVGTTGEASTLSPKEWAEAVTVAVEQARGRVPVICGAGSNDTAKTVERCLAAQECGADGVLLVTPYYNKTSQRGLIAHYTTVADRIDRPVILYDVPSRTGIGIKPDTVRALAAHPRIVALKAASGNVSELAKIAAECDLDIYAGNDDQIVPTLALGGKGVISVLANVMPRQTAAICERWFAGDVAESRRLQLYLLPLIHALFSDVNPIPVKEAMNQMGLDVGGCRLPLIGMDEAGRHALKETLKRYELL